MKKLTLAFLLLTLSFASCQDKYPDLKDGVYAEFVTNKGTFLAKLKNESAPLTVSNFVALAEGTNGMVDSTYKGKRFYDNLTFHRVIKDFMIQGGDPVGDGTGSPGYTFPDEITDTIRFNRKGLLAMANSGPGTNGSQFFITLKETPWLDGRHTVFGEIVKGQEVVDSIGSVETSKPGDKPVSPVTIEKINIIKKGNVKVPYFTEEMGKLEQEKKEKEERINKVAAQKASELNALRSQADSLPSGVKMYYNQKGTGEKPAEGSKVLMNYAGFLADGHLFDSNILSNAEKFETVDEIRKAAGQYAPVPADYSQNAGLIPGFREALLNMKIGDKTTVFIPSHLAYGKRGIPGVIPPDSELIFELELVGLAQ
ncbi:peptidylprolyl isomerase [Aequorivita echinoideorum]|uniref:peptidylprolyl isomerase n=1 Tax=Aequorivita echinoideorum TaxID=1549647 RepID=A0ABS5S4U4_9FLAO|nr:peptidylprolyl isomerase [Aequorivita echinoideorum]MBT0608221.1 peptidylprolyl isomerase [Aequorivita echinoideorum]